MRAETSYEKERKAFYTVPGSVRAVSLVTVHGPCLRCGEEGKRFRLGADSEVVTLGTWLLLPS